MKLYFDYHGVVPLNFEEFCNNINVERYAYIYCLLAHNKNECTGKLINGLTLEYALGSFRTPTFKL